MKGKWMLIVVAVVVVAGIGWLVSSCQKGVAESTEPVVAAGRPVAEQEFLDSVLESPEMLDGESLTAKVAEERGTGEAGVPVCTLPTGKERHLLSDVEKPPAPQPLKEPVSVESLHFHADYASLRTDAIRNPNSPENRAGVVSLMEARQRRLGQK